MPRILAISGETFADVYPPLIENKLLTETAKLRWKQPWDLANPHSFRATA